MITTKQLAAAIREIDESDGSIGHGKLGALDRAMTLVEQFEAESDDGTTYRVVGVAKSDPLSQRVLREGVTIEQAEEYVERNTSPDNFETYQIEEEA